MGVWCRGRVRCCEGAETSFHQDLNGDGVIGVPHDGGPDGVPPASDPHDLSNSQDQLASFLHVADLHAGGVLLH